MKYPNYAKIYFKNEEWCAKLNTKKKEYVSEYLYLEKEENKIDTYEDETYSIEELNKSGLNYIKITEEDYKESIRQKTKLQFKAEIELLHDGISKLYEKIENVKIEEEFILNNY